MNSDASLSPTLYYDGGCSLCAKEIAIYQRQRGSDGVCWIDVSRCDAAALGSGLTRDAAMMRLHLRATDGTLVSGAAAFTGLWVQLPRWAWAGRFLGKRPLLWLLEVGYRAFVSIRPLWRKRHDAGHRLTE